MSARLMVMRAAEGRTWYLLRRFVCGIEAVFGSQRPRLKGSGSGLQRGTSSGASNQKTTECRTSITVDLFLPLTSNLTR